MTFLVRHSLKLRDQDGAVYWQALMKISFLFRDQLVSWTFDQWKKSWKNGTDKTRFEYFFGSTLSNLIREVKSRSFRRSSYPVQIAKIMKNPCVWTDFNFSCWILMGLQVRLRRNTSCRWNFDSRGKDKHTSSQHWVPYVIRFPFLVSKKENDECFHAQIKMINSARCNLLYRLKTRARRMIGIFANTFKRHNTVRIDVRRLLDEDGRKKTKRYRRRNSVKKKLRLWHDKFLESCSSETP